MEDLTCKTCNGEKIIWKKIPNKGIHKRICPTCKGSGKELSKVIEQTAKIKINEETLKTYEVPKYYRNRVFNKKESLRDKEYRMIPRKELDMSFLTILEYMENYLAKVDAGIIPEKSVYLYTPFDKVNKDFAYTVIKNLLKTGNKPSRLYTISEIYSYLDKGEYAELHKDLRDKDVILLEIPTTYSTKNDNIVALQYLSNYCGNKDKALLVISQKPAHILERDKVGFKNPTYIVNNSYEYDYARLEYRSISEGLNKAVYRASLIKKELEETDISKERENIRRRTE